MGVQFLQLLQRQNERASIQETDLGQLKSNIGAHASLGELSPTEIPFLDDLCRAILEYVYSGPQLIEAVRIRLIEIKGDKT